MPYVFVEDFKYGIDRRRPRFAGVPGTLWDGENVHLSRGGDIERAKRFVPTFTGLDGTFGLVEISGLYHVFGSADLAASMPNGVRYVRLQAPGTPAMTRILDAKKFDNKVYAIAEYDDGSRHHFYDGTRVSDWDTVADTLASAPLTYQALADLLSNEDSVTVLPLDDGVLLTASVPGVAFSAVSSIADGGGTADETSTDTTVTANVAPVAAVEATAVLTITGGTFDPNVNTLASLTAGATAGTAIELLGGPVSYVSSVSATATAVAAAINDRTDEHGYSAAAVGADITVTAIVGSGTTPNTYSLFAAVGGDVTVTAGAFSGGVAAVPAVTQVVRITFGGTFEPLDVITVTIDGTAYKLSGRAAATGSRVYVRHNRVWSVAGPGLYYCALNDPTDWTTSTPAATDPGVLVVSTDSDGAQNLTGVESYQQFTAIFSASAVVIYALGTDPDAFETIQELPNTGTLSGRAVRAYGSSDLFFLDSTGIRSLQARDSSNSAFVSDAGTAFDPYVQERIAAAKQAQISSAVSVIEPQTGAYWFALAEEIFVLTNYPGTGIRGWTRYSPGFEVTAFARTTTRVAARDADTIYVYGGTDGRQYPSAGEMVATVKLPFLTARDDAGFKNLTGFDVGAVNAWSVTALVNPNNESETISVGIFDGATYSDDNAEQIGEVTHVAYHLVCNSAGFASLSNMAVHHVGKLRA